MANNPQDIDPTGGGPTGAPDFPGGGNVIAPEININFIIRFSAGSGNKRFNYFNSGDFFIPPAGPVDGGTHNPIFRIRRGTRLR